MALLGSMMHLLRSCYAFVTLKICSVHSCSLSLPHQFIQQSDTVMRKTLLPLLLMWSTSLALHAQNEFSTLVVETTEGAKLEISLQQKPEVKMTEENLTIICGEEVTGYTYGEIRKFYFITPNNGVGIAVPTDERVIRIEYRDYTATIHGVDNPANIQLYALGGKRIAAATSSDGTAVTVSLSSLAPGIYILDIDGKQSFKLLKR